VPLSFPIIVNVSEDLEITVHLHDFFLGDRNRQCWTYVTRGLQQFGQQELTLSLLLEDEDVASEVPKTPLRIFSLLAGYARQGHLVKQGTATRLGKTGLFGFTELYYLPSIQYESLPPLDDHLALILVHSTEHEFARRYGLGRLISRIARYCSCFPYATWNSRQRPSFIDENLVEETVLNQEAAERGIDNILLHKTALTIPVLPGAIGGEDDVVLLCSPNGSAESSLHWKAPGNTSCLTNTTTPQSSAVSFVLVTTGELSYMTLLEDGVLLSLNSNDRRQFNDGHLPSRAFLSNSAEPVATPLHYQSGAALSAPLLAEQILLDERHGNTYLTSLRMISVPLDRHRQLTSLAAEAQQKLVEAMSEETSQFSLEMVLAVDSMEVQATIELNPEFVSFLKSTMADLDRAILGAGSIGVLIHFNT
jgi:hypothetical protein